MKRQKGAALIVVLSLLTVSLMVGLSSMQSSQIDERLAGNYKAYVQAYNAAEAGVSVFYYSNKKSTIEDFENMNPLSGSWPDNNSLGGFRVEVLEVDKGNNSVSFKSTGRYGLGSRQAERVLIGHIMLTSGQSSYEGFIACEGATFGGSGSLDSYDSRIGSYDSVSNSGNDLVLKTLKKGAVLTLNSGSAAEIKGSIVSAGDVRITNSQDVYGSIEALGDVIFDNTAKIFGNVFSDGLVSFNNTAKVNGDIESKLGVVFDKNASGRIVEGNVSSEGYVKFNVGSIVGGDVRANESIYLKGGWTKSNSFTAIEGIAYAPDFGSEFDSDFDADNFVAGGPVEGNPGVIVKSKPEGVDDCPAYDVPNKIAGLQADLQGSVIDNGNFSSNHWQRLPLTDSFYGDDGLEYITEGGIDYFSFSDFKSSGAGFEIERPTVIFVDGDFDLAGYGDIKIADGAFLEVYTTGKFPSSGSSKVDFGNNGSLVDFDGEKRPTFSLFTSYDDSGSCQAWGGGCGVTLPGSGTFSGRIVAPFSKVTVGQGDKFFGSINSRELVVTGGADFHYDVAYSEELEGSTADDGVWRLYKLYPE